MLINPGMVTDFSVVAAWHVYAVWGITPRGSLQTATVQWVAADQQDRSVVGVRHP